NLTSDRSGDGLGSIRSTRSRSGRASMTTSVSSAARRQRSRFAGASGTAAFASRRAALESEAISEPEVDERTVRPGGHQHDGIAEHAREPQQPQELEL